MLPRFSSVPPGSPATIVFAKTTHTSLPESFVGQVPGNFPRLRENLPTRGHLTDCLRPTLL